MGTIRIVTGSGHGPTPTAAYDVRYQGETLAVTQTSGRVRTGTLTVLVEANGTTIHKTVHLFIARSFEASAELSKEHRDLQWRDYEQALNTITQDGPRDIFERAHEYLDQLAAENGEAEDGKYLA